jgi:outer membrane receptor protein involved in Fe transport
MYTVRSNARALALGAFLIGAAATTAPAQQPDTTKPPAADSTRRAPADSSHHMASMPVIRVVAAPTQRADAASSVIILPSAIRTVPATDAWDIVRQTAGVEVHLQGQGPGFASDAAIRGFTSDHSTDDAAFIDGVPLNETVSGHAEGYADWNALIPEAVKSVDVTKGPASPWAGNFAMGGTMNVITLPTNLGTEWSARVGSWGDARVQVLTGSEDADGGWMLAADLQRASGWRDNSQQAIGHVMASKEWYGAGGSTYTLAVSGYGGGWHSPGFISDSQYNAGDLTAATNPTDGGNEGFGTVRGSMQRSAWDGTLTSTLYAHGGTWHIFLTIPPEGGIGEGVQSQTEELDQRFGLGGTTRWAKQFGATHLEVGLDYRVVEAQYQRYYTTDRVRDSVFLFDETPANLSALYAGIAPIVEAHWDVTRDLSLGLGGRLDWIDYSTKQRSGGPTTTDGQWVGSPKLSAIYRFTGKLSAYVSYNGGYRSSDGAIVTPSLPPALERASELGVRYTGQRFEGSMALFLINVSNQQTVDPVTLQPSSGGTTRQQGVELDGRVGLLRWLSLFAHATVNDAHYVHLVTEDGTDLSGQPVFQVARSTVQTGFDLQQGAFAGSIWAAYTGPWTPVNQVGVLTSAYTLLNVRGVFPIAGEWSGAVGVQNILDQKYVEVQASGFISPGTPRQLLLTVRHGF